MSPGDRVRICAGAGKGHIGVIEEVSADRVSMRVPTLKALAGGVLHAKRASVVVLGPVAPVKVAAFTPYRPSPFVVPRPGSEVASKLPSVAGDQLLYPTGLR